MKPSPPDTFRIDTEIHIHGEVCADVLEPIDSLNQCKKCRDAHSFLSSLLPSFQPCDYCTETLAQHLASTND